jgi:hypothetical protein
MPYTQYTSLTQNTKSQTLSSAKRADTQSDNENNNQASCHSYSILPVDWIPSALYTCSLSICLI